MKMSRSVYRYEPRLINDEELTRRIQALALQKPRYGYRKLAVLLKREGWEVNHKKVYRIYKALKLPLLKRKRRRVRGNKEKLWIAKQPCEIWSLDFMGDSLMNGRRYRTLNIVDDFYRGGLTIEVDFSISAEGLVRVLNYLGEIHGYPNSVRLDNGPELRSHCLAKWAELHAVKLVFIEPGKPAQNGLVERFKDIFRDECLNQYCFKHLHEVKEIVGHWLQEYNYERPHEALNNMTPMEYLTHWKQNSLLMSGTN